MKKRLVVQGCLSDAQLDTLNDLFRVDVLSNVVALPHIGSATHETRDAMAQRAVDNIRLAMQGERPISLVNEETYQ